MESLRSVHRLSNNTMVLGCQRTRAWKSWPLTICCMRKSSSHFCSVSLSPCTLAMNSPFRNRHFSPVTGWTRTSGCTVSTGSLRIKLPVRRAWLIILVEEWTAVRPSKKERKVGESRLSIPAGLVFCKLGDPRSRDLLVRHIGCCEHRVSSDFRTLQ